MPEKDDKEARVLAKIPNMTNQDELRTLVSNAQRLKFKAVEKAAFARLCAVQPSAKHGTIENDVWQSIHALEELLKEERSKTVRLSRTRQKIQRDGEIKTVADLTLKPDPSAGFHELIKRGHPNLLFESVALRYPQHFSEDVLTAAKKRLDEAGL